MTLRKFDEQLYTNLRNPDYAKAYLNAAIEDGGIDDFLYALREVAAAQDGGIQKVAEITHIGRESMYKSLSKNGNPSIKTIRNILKAINMDIAIT